MVFLLAGTSLLTDDLCRKHELPMTTAARRNRENWENKFGEIDPEFFDTPAMRSKWWKEASCGHRGQRRRSGFHEPDENCICELCHGKRTQYHIYHCPEKAKFDWTSPVEPPSHVHDSNSGDQFSARTILKRHHNFGVNKRLID